ncbi:xanthine dehydrogenase family protein subunit M [Streptomyces sp. WAC06614]|uniref:FAD binding domain-containing protein n=1 Tax=Streptomyces sp. WAC06614 TaxID=2487416 RepID=UPI000F7845E0|nr:xanthine dehydrogenase family protein subunit M [Streptomyces sp. WAC06614]RSS80793.1 xanthine dehydrogenase family protein subunit M [Streptomyces sp. WAC06614]
MRPFAYARPATPEEAVALVAQDPDAVYVAGGTNLVDHLKLGIVRPHLLVDVTGLPLNDIEALPDGGVRVGANVRNADLAARPEVRERWPVVSQALLAGASPQLRNMATLAGNLMQRTRCPSFENPETACNKRDPGSGCAAVAGRTGHRAVLGASPACVAVHPSDLAVALCAVDAVACVLGRTGTRRIPVTALHRLPGDHPERDTVLDHGDLVTAVELPPLPMAARSRYRKVGDRASFTFALVSVAAAVDLDGDRIRDVRIAFGGLAAKPWRATRAEAVLRGAPATADRFAAAADAELAAARAVVPADAYRIPLARDTLVATLLDLCADAQDRPAGAVKHEGRSGRATP